MASYSIYFDETGDFQGIGNNAFYAICGFVWERTADSIKENLKKFCNDLADWLKTNGKDGSKPFPACLHTTDNNALKTLLSDHTPETDILHSRLRDLPLSITGIYTFKDEVNQADFTLDAVYRKMIHLLMRRITEQIRQKDSEADITFHIPTRDIKIFEFASVFVSRFIKISFHHAGQKQLADVGKPSFHF